MMIEFSYTKTDNSTKTYTVMVIDPDYNGYLHALLLDNLSDFEIVKLATELGNVFNYDPMSPSAPITNLQSNDAYNRYKLSGYRDDRRYRTFIVNKITGLRQILIGELS